MESAPNVSLSPTSQELKKKGSPSSNYPLKISSSSSSGTYPPIRAPPSSDFDVDKNPLNLNGDKAAGISVGGSRSSSGRSSIVSSDIEEEERFMSGEEGFETASERPFVGDPDDEALELPVEEEEFEDSVVGSVVGASEFGSSMPKARVSGDDNMEDEEAPRVAAEVNEEEEEGPETVGDSNFKDAVEVEDGGSFEESGAVKSPGDDGVLDSEGKEPHLLEKNPVMASGSSFGEAFDEVFVANVCNIPAGNLKLDEVVDDEVREKEDDVVKVKKEVLEGDDIAKFDPSKGDDSAIDAKEELIEAEQNGIFDVKEAGLPAEKTAVLSGGRSEGSRVVKEPIDSNLVKANDDDEIIEKSADEMQTADDMGKEKKEVLAADLIAKSNSGEVDDAVVDSKHLIEAEQDRASEVQEARLPAEKSAVLSSESGEGSTVVEEPVDSNFVEVGKDDEIEEKPADEMKEQVLVGVETGGFKELEENQVSESNTLELSVERVDGSDIATCVIEEPVDAKSVEEDIDDISKVYESSSAEHFSSENSLKPPTSSIMKEPETDSETVKKGVDETNDGVVGDNVSMPPASDDSNVKPEVEIGQQNDLGSKLNEPKPSLAAGGVESEHSNTNDGPDVAENKNPSSNLEYVNSAQNDEEKNEEQNKVQFAAAEGSDRSLAADSDGLEMRNEAEDNVNPSQEYIKEDEGSMSDEENEGGLLFEGSETAKQIMKELARGSGSHSDAESSRDPSQIIDGQIIMESDEEVDTDEDEGGKELFDSAALTALLKAATSAGSDGGSVTITSPDGSRLFSVERPAGLGSSIRSLRSAAPRPNLPNIFGPSDLTEGRESDDKLSDEEKKKLEKIQLLRVKFLRLISRVGHSPDDSIAAQVLYRLVLASGRHTSQAFSLEAAKTKAMQLEAESADGKNDLDFSLNVLVLGKTGVGKSATINSIFGQEKAIVDAFEPATTSVKEIVGTVDGVKIRVFDTPGLKSSVMEQSFNQRILSSVKKLTKKCPLDILLYVDRLDTQTRDLNDLPLLRTITSTLGSSIWKSAIVTLTHAASAPPDGPSGSPLSYEVFVAQRSHIVQQAVGQAVGDLRMMNPSLMNPVSLVENHPSCRRNREGQRILPNGQSWRSQLLLLCYSLKILSEASSLSKPQDAFDHRKLFGFRVRSPPLPYLLSSLLQSRAHPKLPTDQGGDNVDSDIDLEDLSDSDQEEEEDEYDQLPPFKPLRKSQISKLSNEQKKAYFDEYDYRVKLLQKKQWKEELRRMREMKKMGKSVGDNQGFIGEDADQENGGPAAVPVPLPDMVLPPSFDGDNPAYRYRFLEPTSQLLARPVLDTHGWDHDCGYDGVSLEENLAIAGKFPAGVAIQITKDKKEFNIHLDSSVAAKHGENGSTLAGFDIQTIGKQLAYIIKGETRFKNLKKNKTTGGISITFLGENVVTGLKLEDQISMGKRLVLVGSTGTIRSQGDVAYGANLEARLKESDYPIGQDQTTLGLSLMRWRGDLALGANLQSQFSIGRSSKMSIRVGLNNKLSGQITVRTTSSEQLQLALVGVLPIAMAIYRSIFPAAGESYSAY